MASNPFLMFAKDYRTFAKTTGLGPVDFKLLGKVWRHLDPDTKQMWKDKSKGRAVAGEDEIVDFQTEILERNDILDETAEENVFETANYHDRDILNEKNQVGIAGFQNEYSHITALLEELPENSEYEEPAYDNESSNWLLLSMVFGMTMTSLLLLN